MGMWFGENRTGGQSLITGLFVTVLAMIGLVDSDDLRSVKPTGSGVWKPVRSLPSLVPARLWEDPLEAVSRTLPRDDPSWGPWQADLIEEGRLCYGFVRDPPLSGGPGDGEGVGALWESFLGAEVCGLRDDEGAARGDVTVMAVTIRQGASAEDREWRLRSRYAVLAGLLDGGFEPDHGDFLGAFRVKAQRTPFPDVPGGLEKASVVAVPFEWWHRADGHGALVLWIDEAILEIAPGAPVELLEEVRSQVEGARTAGTAGGPGHQARAAFIGPSNSGLRKELLDANTTLTSLGDGSEDPLWYSPWATVPVEVTEGNQVPPLLPTIGADDVLADALVRELASRYRPSADHGTHCGPGPCYVIRDDPDHCRCGMPVLPHLDIALVAEADSSYGRYWQEAFETALGSFSEAMKCDTPERSATSARYERGVAIRLLPTLSYVRGIDGFIPGLGPSSKSSASSPDGSTGNASAELVRAMAALQDSDFGEKASGTSQFDYLRRAELGLEGRHPDAIGVLGSDVYDTLVVLQALRDRFPDAIFFTTDLDARYIEDETIGLTRNLIIAAHDGFTPSDVDELVDPDKLPPQFRSSYQTSTYRAVRAALEGEGASSRWITRADQPPQLFEVGARRIVPLGGVWTGGQQQPAQQTFEDRYPLPSWLDIALALIPLVALLRLIGLMGSIPSSRRRELTRADRAARRSRWIGTVILAVVGLYAAYAVPELYRAGKAGWGEPSGFIEGKGLPGILLGSLNGVSSWATELLRVVAVLLGLRWLFRVIPDRLTTSQARIRDMLHDDTFRALWDRHDLEADPRRPLRVLSIVIGTTLVMAFGFGLLRLTGMPVAPVRSAAWLRFDFVVTMTAVVLMQALVLLGVDQTRRCTSFVREQIVRVRRLDASQLHEVIDALARRTEVVERCIVYPAVLALLMILSRSRVFDAWTWPFGLIILVGGTLTVLAFTTWWLRSSCRALKTTALARLRDPALPPVSGTDQPAELLKWARACVEDEGRGGFSSVLANPVLEAFMIPLVGLVGVDVLSGFV